MTRRPSPWRRVIWGLVAIGAAGAILTLVSLPHTFRPLDARLFGSRYEAWVEDGRIGLLRTTTVGTYPGGHSMQVYWGGRGAPAPVNFGFQRMKARATAGAVSATTDGALIPVWFVALILGAGWTGWTVARWRRMVRGGCRRCGYDTEGLGTGPCPECGTPASR